MSEAGVVVGVDGSPASQRALKWAAHEAKIRQTDVAAVIVDPQPTLAPYAPMPADPREQRLSKLREILDRTVDAALGPEPEVTVHKHVVEGRVADVLAEYAKDADLLVLGNSKPERVESTLAPTIRNCIRHARSHIVVVNTDNPDL